LPKYFFVRASVDSLESFDGNLNSSAYVRKTLASGIPYQHPEEDAKKHKHELHVKRTRDELLLLHWAASCENAYIFDRNNPTHCSEKIDAVLARNVPILERLTPSVLKALPAKVEIVEHAFVISRRERWHLATSDVTAVAANRAQGDLRQ
jgi:hypothetical protein